MRNLWITFCCVLFFSVTFFAFFGKKNVNAQERGPASASGLKSDVPLSRELEYALERKKQDIEQKERELSIHQKKVEEESREVEIKISKLEELLKEKEIFDKEKKKQASGEFQKLVKSFEKMPPKKAADVISGLETKIALDVLSNLKEKTIAAILSAMDSTKATALTSELAQRVPALEGK